MVQDILLSLIPNTVLDSRYMYIIMVHLYVLLRNIKTIYYYQFNRFSMRRKQNPQSPLCFVKNRTTPKSNQNLWHKLEGYIRVVRSPSSIIGDVYSVWRSILLVLVRQLSLLSELTRPSHTSRKTDWRKEIVYVSLLLLIFKTSIVCSRHI